MVGRVKVNEGGVGITFGVSVDCILPALYNAHHSCQSRSALCETMLPTMNCRLSFL